MVGRWLSFGAWCHPNASAFETPSHATRELGPGDRATKGLRPRDSSAGEARRKCWELVPQAGKEALLSFLERSPKAQLPLT